MAVDKTWEEWTYHYEKQVKSYAYEKLVARLEKKIALMEKKNKELQFDAHTYQKQIYKNLEVGDKNNFWTFILDNAKREGLIRTKDRPMCKCSWRKCRRKAQYITSYHAYGDFACGCQDIAKERLREGVWWWDNCEKCWDDGWEEAKNDWTNSVDPDIVPAEILYNVEPEQHDSEPDDDITPPDFAHEELNGYVIEEEKLE